tara:strand:+ start:20214 stop:21563 length:1350 start_codon:yes stop_codon:yes gene_type:complete
MSVVASGGAYQDTSNFEGALKVFYAAKIVQTLNKEVVLRNRLTSQGKKKWNGKQHETSIHLRSSQAVGARPEGGYIPDAGKLTYDKAVIKSKYNYCTVSVTGVAEAQSTGSKGAWARCKAENIQQAASDLSFDLGRQCYGSPEGYLGQCQSVTGSGTDGDPWIVVLNSGAPAASGTSTPSWMWKTSKNFRVGMNVAWGTDGTAHFSAAASTARGFGSITAVADDGTYTQITIVGTNAPVAGDVFVRGDGLEHGKHSYGEEMEGLSSIVSSSGNLHTIDATQFPEWTAKEFSNPAGPGTDRPLTEQLLQHALDKIKVRSNGKPDLAICHTSVRNALVFHLKDQGRERYAPMKMEAGWNVLSYNAGDRPLKIVADRQARHGKLWLLDTRYLHTYDVKPFAWDESNGSVWKWVANQDKMIAFGKVYTELGTTNRAAHGVINDIAVSSYGVFE